MTSNPDFNNNHPIQYAHNKPVSILYLDNRHRRTKSYQLPSRKDSL